MTDEPLEAEVEESETPPLFVPQIDDPRHLAWLSMKLGHALHHIERLEMQIELLQEQLDTKD